MSDEKKAEIIKSFVLGIELSEIAYNEDATLEQINDAINENPEYIALLKERYEV